MSTKKSKKAVPTKLLSPVLYKTNSMRGLQSPRSNRFLVSLNDELIMMRAVEMEQIRIDRFFGIDHELKLRENEQVMMQSEDNYSFVLNQEYKQKQREILWEKEFYSDEYSSIASAIEENEQRRQKYIKNFYKYPNVDTVINFSMKNFNGYDNIIPNNNKYNRINDEINEKLYHLTRNQVNNRKSLKASLASALRSEIEFSKISSNQIYHRKSSKLYGNHTIDSKVYNKYNELIDGHADFRWDQPLALSKAFTLLSNNNLAISSDELINIYHDEEIIQCLKFTMFSPYVKKKQMKSLFHGKQITLQDWIELAKSLVIESHLTVEELRSDHEHKSIVLSENNKSIKKWFGESLRNHRYRQLSQYKPKVGDIVWRCFARGVIWLPAIVTSIDNHLHNSFYTIKYCFNQQDFDLNRKSERLESIIESVPNSFSSDDSTVSESTSSQKQRFQDLLYKISVISNDKDIITSLSNEEDDTFDKSNVSQLNELCLALEDIILYGNIGNHVK